MKTLALFIVLFSFASTSHAYNTEHQDITKRWGVGFNVSGSIPQTSDADGGWYGGATFTYGILDRIALELETGFIENNYDSLGLEFGDLQGNPVIVSLQWRYPFLVGNLPSTLYGTTGLGMIFWDFDNLGVPGATPADIGDAFALKLGAGVDFFLTDHWVANVEASYMFSDTDVTLTTQGGQTTSEDTDYWRLGGGMKYFF